MYSLCSSISHFLLLFLPFLRDVIQELTREKNGSFTKLSVDCWHYIKALHSNFLKSGEVLITFLKGLIESDNSPEHAIFWNIASRTVLSKRGIRWMKQWTFLSIAQRTENVLKSCLLNYLFAFLCRKDVLCELIKMLGKHVKKCFSFSLTVYIFLNFFSFKNSLFSLTFAKDSCRNLCKVRTPDLAVALYTCA